MEKKISRFEFAIMELVHSTQPDKVTEEDLKNASVKTELEEIQERIKKVADFESRIRHKNPNGIGMKEK